MPTRYVSLDPRFEELIDRDAEPERIATGYRFTEGPVWNAREKALIFVDTRAHSILRWTPDGKTTVFRENARSTSGNTYDLQGRLLSCESRISKLVSRTDHDGTVETVASHYEGMHLSSPNDLICLSNGDVLFTDPPFGLGHSDGSVDPRETPCNGVYRIRATDGYVQLLTGEVETPNGLVYTDDGRLLVADTRGHDVKAFDIRADGSCAPGKQFANTVYKESTGRPDGMKLDELGNLYVAANTAEGLWVYSPDGVHLGFIGFDEHPANLAWGDDDWQTLYVTAETSVYRLRMNIKGQRLNP